MTEIRSASDMEKQALKLGFLPFFYCGVDGFSVEDMISSDYWFSGDGDGAWEWKGPVIKEGHCAYGKIFAKKAGYVSLKWLPDLANYRRSKPQKISEDLLALDDIVLQTITSEGTATIKELRRLLGFARGRSRRSAADLKYLNPMEEKISLDPILTRLQMRLRIVISDFEYNIDSHGQQYGWGIARYTTPEALYGNFMQSVENRTPEKSYQRILAHLKKLFPKASDAGLQKIIG